MSWRATSIAALKDGIVADGAPGWLTPQLVEHTLQVWQVHYGRPLTTREAIEILLDVGRLLDLLEETDEEAVSGARPRVEP